MNEATLLHDSCTLWINLKFSLAFIRHVISIIILGISDLL